MEILEELLSIQEEIKLPIEGLNVNGLTALTSISHGISYHTGQYRGGAVGNYEVCMNDIILPLQKVWIHYDGNTL